MYLPRCRLWLSWAVLGCGLAWLPAAETPAALGVGPAPAASVQGEATLRSLRVLPEPLVPIRRGPVDAGEDATIAEALQRTATIGPVEACEQIAAVFAAHPHSRWSPSLGIGLGVRARREGLFVLAEATWRTTWERWRDDRDPIARACAERGFGEWMQCLAWQADEPRLRRLMDEQKERAFNGTAQARVDSARAFLDFAVDDLVVVRKLAAYAPGCLLAQQQPEVPAVQIYNLMRSTLVKLSSAYDEGVDAAMLTPSTLIEVRDVARSLGLPLRIAARNPGAPIPVPAIVPWTIGHASALLAQQGDRYLIRDWRHDPAYPEILITAQAIERSAIAVWLIPEGPLPAGWRAVSDAEAQRITSH